MTWAGDCPAHVDPVNVDPAPAAGTAPRAIAGGTAAVLLVLAGYLAWIFIVAWVMA